jgi:hypothetical protein
MRGRLGLRGLGSSWKSLANSGAGEMEGPVADIKIMDPYQSMRVCKDSSGTGTWDRKTYYGVETFALHEQSKRMALPRLLPRWARVGPRMAGQRTVAAWVVVWPCSMLIDGKESRVFEYIKET